MRASKKPARAETLASQHVQAVVMDAETPTGGNDTALAALDVVEQAIGIIQDADSAREAVANLKTLEDMLKAAKRFNEMAARYARLEAEIYVRIVEMGLLDEVPAKNYGRQPLRWLSGLTAEERASVVEKCGSDGITIRAYWMRAVHEPEMAQGEIEEMKYEAAMAIAEFKESGRVNLDDLFARYEKPNSRIPADMRIGYKNKIRDRIRDLGGHGVGDGTGLYLSRENAVKEAKDIVLNKASSILDDIERMRQFVDEGEPFDLPLKTKSNFSSELDDQSNVNMLLVMSGIANPYFETQQSWTKAKICCSILAKLGMPLGRLLTDLAILSYQADESRGAKTHIDLKDYGFTERMADAVGKAVIESAELSDTNRFLPNFLYEHRKDAKTA